MGTALTVWRKHRIEYRPVRFRTICEVLRELAKDAEARKDHLSLQRIEEAYDMAKRMQKKLLKYSKYEIYSSVDEKSMMEKRLNEPLLDNA